MDLSRYSAADFDRGASRAREVLWAALKCIFFQPPWPLPSAFRVWLLRKCGAQVGRGVIVRSQVNITFPWRLRIGDHVWIGEGVFILSLAPVVIESNVCISQQAFLCTGSHRFREVGFDLETKPITLRSGCWIAARAFVGPGVEVGAGSLVSAGSVVLEDVPPDSLVQGNPAQVVKKLR